MKNQKVRIHNRMGRLIAVCSTFLVCGLAAGTLQAQNSQTEQKPVNKVAVQFEGTNIVFQVGPEGPGPQDLVSAQVQTVQTNRLLIDIGAQVKLVTANMPGSSEFAILDVRVFVDGSLISPGIVRYGDQSTHWTPGLPDNTYSLSRLDAASFSFVTGDLAPGVHTILAKAYLAGSGAGGGGIDGSVGKGTMTVETVHVITNPSDIPTLK